MEGYPISESWLERRIDRDSSSWRDLARQFQTELEPGDEIYNFDEPAPEGINAGALGVALVRNGRVIETIITGIH